MKGFFRGAVLILLLLCLFPVFSLPVSAVEAEESLTEDQMIEEQLKESGLDNLIQIVPEEGQDLFSGGFTPKDVEEMTPSNIFTYIGEKAMDKVKSPFRLFLSVSGILLLSALISSLGDGVREENLQKTFSIVATLAVGGVLAQSISTLILRTGETIKELSYFVLSFIPVFSGIAAAAGKPASAIAYHATIFSAIQLFSQLAANVILPLLGIYLAISMTGAVTDVIKVDGLCKSVKTAAGWILSLCLTVFIGLLTLKGLVTSAADSVTVRATKFMLSSFVPVVGSALSEAYTSLFSCLGVVKSTVGVFGIVAMVAVFLPVVLELTMMLAALNLSAIVGEIFDQQKCVSILRACSSVLSILLGLVLCYGMMIIVATTILLVLGGGGG